MSKTCNNCGSILEDDALFCGNCGTQYAEAPVETPVEAPVEAPVEEAVPAPAPKKNWKPIIIAAAAALAVLVLIIVVCSSGGYKSAAKHYQSVMNGKASAIEKLAPKAYWEYLEEEEDVDIDEVIEEFEDMYDEIQESWEDEYGKNVKVTVKIKDSEKMKSKDVKAIGEALEDRYDFIDEDDVKKAYEVELEMTIKGRDDDDDQDLDAAAVKIGGKWYLISYYEYDDSVSARFLVDSLL